MMNRIHYKNEMEALSTADLLTKRGYKNYILKNGCAFENGRILEMGDNAAALALDIASSFGLVVAIEQ